MELYEYSQKPSHLDGSAINILEEKNSSELYRHTTVTEIKEIIDVEQIAPPSLATGAGFDTIDWIDWTARSQIR